MDGAGENAAAADRQFLQFFAATPGILLSIGSGDTRLQSENTVCSEDVHRCAIRREVANMSLRLVENPKVRRFGWVRGVDHDDGTGMGRHDRPVR